MRTTKPTLVALTAFTGASLIDAASTMLSTTLPRSWSLETIEHDDGTRSLVAMNNDATIAYRISVAAKGLALEELGADDELRFLGTGRTAGSLALMLDQRIGSPHAPPRAA